MSLRTRRSNKAAEPQSPLDTAVKFFKDWLARVNFKDLLPRILPRVKARMLRQDMMVFMSLLLAMLITVMILAVNLNRILPDYMGNLIEYQGNTARFEKEELPLTRMLSAPEGYHAISVQNDKGDPVWPHYDLLNLPALLNLMDLNKPADTPDASTDSYEVYPEMYYRPEADGKEESWYISAYLVDEKGLTNKMNVLIDDVRGITLIECLTMRDPSVTVDPKDAEIKSKAAVDIAEQFLHRLVGHQLEMAKKIREIAPAPTPAPGLVPAASAARVGSDYMDIIVPENEKMVPEVNPLENGYFRITYNLASVQVLVDVDAINAMVTRYQIIRT